MPSLFILEDVSVVENDFSADSRDKDGMRIVSFEARRSLSLHFAVDHIVQIEAVKDSKEGAPRSIITLTSGKRYISRRGAQELCTAIGKLAPAA
jgi:uncharacterized protein YlzI (FlbEa/FlbD family)